jgi:hypothetical protein
VVRGEQVLQESPSPIRGIKTRRQRSFEEELAAKVYVPTGAEGHDRVQPSIEKRDLGRQVVWVPEVIMGRPDEERRVSQLGHALEVLLGADVLLVPEASDSAIKLADLSTYPRSRIVRRIVRDDEPEVAE